MWIEIMGVSLRCSWRLVGDHGGFLNQSESRVSFEFQMAVLYYRSALMINMAVDAGQQHGMCRGTQTPKDVPVVRRAKCGCSRLPMNAAKSEFVSIMLNSQGPDSGTEMH